MAGKASLMALFPKVADVVTAPAVTPAPAAAAAAPAPATGTADAAPVTTDAAPSSGSQEPPPTLVTPEPESAIAAPTLADLEKQRDDLVATRAKLRRIVSAGGDELPLGQTTDDILLGREESEQRVASAQKEMVGASEDLLSVLRKITEFSTPLAPVPSFLGPETTTLDRPPSRIDNRSAADIRRRIREAETGRRELRSVAPTALGRGTDRLLGRDLSEVDANSGQRFYPVKDIDPVFGVPWTGGPKTDAGQALGEAVGGYAGLPRKLWEDPSGAVTFPFLGSSAAEKSYRMNRLKYGPPLSVQNPTTGRTETMPFGTPIFGQALEMEKLGLDPANPEDRRKWAEELDPRLVPGGGRDPQMETLVEDPLLGQQWGYERYSDEAYQKEMGSGLMKTAKGERPEVRDMSNIPIDERRSHYEGLSLDDRAKRAIGEFTGAQMLLTEIDDDIGAMDGGSMRGNSKFVRDHYRELQVKKSVTEDFIHQSKAILAQLRRQQYRRALKAKSDTEFGEQF